MTPEEARDNYYAQYYITMKDGITPQMYYKWETIRFNDGTNVKALCYLSFANLWMGSSLRQKYSEKELITKVLKPIG